MTASDGGYDLRDTECASSADAHLHWASLVRPSPRLDVVLSETADSAGMVAQTCRLVVAEVP